MSLRLIGELPSEASYSAFDASSLKKIHSPKIHNSSRSWPRHESSYSMMSALLTAMAEKWPLPTTATTSQRYWATRNSMHTCRISFLISRHSHRTNRRSTRRKQTTLAPKIVLWPSIMNLLRLNLTRCIVGLLTQAYSPWSGFLTSTCVTNYKACTSTCKASKPWRNILRKGIRSSWCHFTRHSSTSLSWCMLTSHKASRAALPLATSKTFPESCLWSKSWKGRGTSAVAGSTANPFRVAM